MPINEIDCFDANWTSIERKEGLGFRELKSIATVRSVKYTIKVAPGQLRLIFAMLLLWLVTYPCSGQRSVVGKWNYVGIQPVDSDPWSQKLIDIMIGKNSYKQFYTNNLYTAYENNRSTHGRWALIDDGNKLVTISYDGEIRTFEITKMTNDTLIILGKKKTYGTLVKDVNAGDDFVKDTLQNSPLIRGTIKKISKKWTLKDTKLISTPTVEEKMANRIFTNTLRLSWYDFKSDGVVLSKFNDLKKMKWYFENKNKSIVIVDDNGDGSLWNIISITTTELILQKPHAATQLIFESDRSKTKTSVKGEMVEIEEIK